MRYVNAREVLPEPLVRELQKVVQGGYLYVPKDERSRKRWGEESGYRGGSRRETGGYARSTTVACWWMSLRNATV